MTCRHCSTSLAGMGPAARFCSERCRSAWRKAQPVAVAEPDANDIALAVSTELERLGLTDHPLATIASRLATQLDRDTPPGAMAAIAKQLAAILSEARDLGREPEADFVDELRARIRDRPRVASTP